MAVSVQLHPFLPSRLTLACLKVTAMSERYIMKILISLYVLAQLSSNFARLLTLTCIKENNWLIIRLNRYLNVGGFSEYVVVKSVTLCVMITSIEPCTLLPVLVALTKLQDIIGADEN